MRRLSQLLLVGAGGALGTITRWLLAQTLSAEGFPWPTFAANISGCALLGVLAASVRPERLTWLLSAGFCGGLTTMSAFAVETVDLWNTDFSTSVVYLVASLAAGLTAFAGARAVSRGGPA